VDLVPGTLVTRQGHVRVAHGAAEIVSTHGVGIGTRLPALERHARRRSTRTTVRMRPVSRRDAGGDRDGAQLAGLVVSRNHAVSTGDPLHVAIFCALLATFLGSPLRGPGARLAGACAGAVAAGALCVFLSAGAELAPLAAGLGGILAFAGPALGNRSRASRHSPGRFEGSAAGLPRAGARGRW
jgi:hypothetical protein